MTASLRDVSGLTLARLLPGQDLPSQATGLKFNSIQLDSRKVEEGDLFVALKGSESDGHDFVESSFAKGARAALIEHDQAERFAGQAQAVIPVPNLRNELGMIAARFYGEPSKGMDLVAVTGTNGKTSCCQFIAQALQTGDRRCGVIGTLGYGAVGELLDTGLTTPDAISVQKILAELANQGFDIAAMEVSSHALDQGRINGVAVDTAVFTNLSRDHLDYHKDMASYGAAKQQLFFIPSVKRAVINGDDDFGQTIAAQLPAGVECYRYGLDSEALEIRAKNIRVTAQGVQASITSPWGQGILTSDLLGRFNLRNLLAVFSVLCIEGFDVAAALAAIARIRGVPGRMQFFGGEQMPLIVVDYAHTPDALETTLTTLQEIKQGDLTCVFGCGGDRDAGKREQMGQVAEQFADHVLLTDDNPRKESPADIVKDILRGFSNPADCEVEHDRAAAIGAAVLRARRGDVVLVAGKGHENYQQIGAARIAFNDAEQVKQALQRWKSQAHD